MLTRTVQQYLTSRRTLVPTLLGLTLLLALGLSARGSYAAEMLLQAGQQERSTQVPAQILKEGNHAQWDGSGIPPAFGGQQVLPGAGGEAGATNSTAGDEVAMPSAPPCSPNWTLVSSENRVTRSSQLLGISGASPNDIWAVGFYEDGPTSSNRTLIEHWNGTEWVRVPSYNEGTDDNILRGVVAVSANDAWAVGSYYDTAASKWRSLIVRWNGTSWYRVSAPSPPGFDEELFAISKVDGNNIWAVGYYEPTDGDRQGLTMRWTGAAWSLSYPPNPAGATTDHTLTSVSIVPGSSGNDVWAAGYFDAGSNAQTLVLHWTGASWSHVSSPNPGASADDYLMGVSATGTNDVWFSGYYGATGAYVPLTLRWTGSSFTTLTAPGAGTSSQLFQIAALAPNNVWAVGFYLDGLTTVSTLVEHWDGTAWSIVPSANPTGRSGLQAVTAIDGNNVWAAYVHAFGLASPAHTLIERYNGSSFVQTPSPNGPTDVNVLLGVSARTATDVWAVGASANNPSVASTLVQHWDGTAWSIVSSENVGAMSVLQDVAAVSQNDAWAVGFSGTSPQRTLIERYNGTNWSPVASPNIGSNDNELLGVSAASTYVVWAVGSYDDGTAKRTLTLRWAGSGSSWNPISSPNPAGASVDHILESVAVVPGTVGHRAWAVGRTAGVGVTSEPIVLDWTGSIWEPATLPASAGDTELLDVSVRAHNDVWAVGSTFSGGSWRTYILHYDGTTWSQAVTPNQGSGNNELESVVALAANDVWAAGSYIVGPGVKKALLLHFDGSTWSIVTAPSTNSTETLHDLAAVSSYNVWGVGRSQASDVSSPDWGHQTLAMHLNKCPCTTQFNDAPPGSPFYENVRCLACRDILSGYGCGAPGEPCPGNYFRPNANVTRGQAAKIIANAANYNEAIPASQQTFNDVPPDSPFWVFIERVYGHGAISGYACGAPGEPCPGVYFRPGANLTRGQLAKIATEVAEYNELLSVESFEDVPFGSTFHLYIERARLHGIISGYTCGAPGEPCPGAYFRPGNNVTRGQTAKIVANTFYPSCVTPARP
ncbi:MAG: S-layer homology domain-containing protein [Chloroflexota bacterium]|nr:S-layer homology domain-containing protein [Chloroflexota bacterium]